jgi:hypothetical protein
VTTDVYDGLNNQTAPISPDTGAISFTHGAGVTRSDDANRNTTGRGGKR